MKEWVETVHVVRRIDALVVAGTGIIHHNDEGFFGLPWALFRWSLVTRLLGRKLVYLSVGVSPLTKPAITWLLTTALGLAHYRSYRDAASRDRIAELLPEARADAVHPDLAFSLPLPPSLRGSRPVPGRVAVGVYGTGEPAQQARYVEEIGAFVLRLIEAGHTVRITLGDVTWDERVREALVTWLDGHGAPAGSVLADPPSSPTDVLRHLAEAELVVATRFHNIVCGLLLGKPCLSITHIEKNEALMKEIGMGAFCVPLPGVKSSDVLERFGVLERQASLPGELRRMADRRRGELEDQYKLVFGLLTEGAEHHGHPAQASA